MFTLKKPSKSELIVITSVRANCYHCTATQEISTHSSSSHVVEVVARELSSLGWRSYRDKGIERNVCRTCSEAISRSYGFNKIITV